MIRKYLLSITLIFLCLAGLAGCGQSGPLYLPETSSSNTTPTGS